MSAQPREERRLPENLTEPDTLEEANDYGELSSPRSVPRPPFSEEPFDPNCAEDWERLLGYREPRS